MLHHRDSHNEQVRPSENYDRLSNCCRHLLLRLYWALQQARFVLHLCTSQFQRRIFRCVESYRDWTSSSIGPLLFVGYVRDSVCYQHVLVVHKAHLIVLLFSCIYILYGTLVAKRSKMHSFCMPVLTKGSRGSIRMKPFERSLFNSNVFKKSSHKCPGNCMRLSPPFQNPVSVLC